VHKARNRKDSVGDDKRCRGHRKAIALL
jgi:hypothetical protein